MKKIKAKQIEINTLEEFFATHEEVNTTVNNAIESLLSEDTGALEVADGGTGQTSIEDTVYTAPRYRASALVENEVTPTINGVIYWVYE